MELEQNNVLALTVQQLSEYSNKQIEAVLSLLEDGNTVPFIARYRKEVTGALDEVQIKHIQDTHHYLSHLVKKKEEVLRLIAEQGKLTEDLTEQIASATKLQQLEDIYRPYKQKRRTKATIAKEKGLEPLATWVLSGTKDDVFLKAEQFISENLDVLSVEDALDGAHEIMAESIGDESKYRQWIRHYLLHYSVLVTRVKEKENDERGVYSMYYEFSSKLSALKSYHILAINRAEKEGIIKTELSFSFERIMDYFEKKLIKHDNSPSAKYIRQAYEDSFKRFIFPSLEREIRNELTNQAEQQAIHVFGENLKNLLMQSPMANHIVLGLDPAYRTGCKLAVVDETGRLLEKSVIYPHKPAPEHKRQQAGELFKNLILKHHVTIVAIGNGTASRESELFVSQCIKELPHTVQYIIVNEAGASVYSASEIARIEFPDFQVEERSAISIARRLQDPLAELVKIDPKSVGIGQYQHDVSQKALETELNFVVETVVNQVGVNLNTASVSLLQHISGLNKAIANNIVAFRNENGAFSNRQQLKQVPRLGPKAFEQSVGFLRISQGDTVLDNTAIHPESYEATIKLLTEYDIPIQQIGQNNVSNSLKHININEAMTITKLGQQTIEDILTNLQKPGRDIRESVAAPILRTDVLTMDDLKIGMLLQGTVRNVVDFGAFVDIGVKQDGLVHLSKLAKKFVKNAADIVSVGDIVTVWVEEIDMQKHRISLTMIEPQGLNGKTI